MKIVGIIYICVGIALTILHTFNKDIVGILSAVMVFICGLIIVLIN